MQKKRRHRSDISTIHVSAKGGLVPIWGLGRVKDFSPLQVVGYCPALNATSTAGLPLTPYLLLLLHAFYKHVEQVYQQSLAVGDVEAFVQAGHGLVVGFCRVGHQGLDVFFRRVEQQQGAQAGSGMI